MSMGSHARSLTGVLTVGIFCFAALSIWPSQPVIGGILGLLGLYRFVMIFRQWPRRED